MPKYSYNLLNLKNMEAGNWYKMLIKPSWAPPSWLFGPVWTVLYIIITISYGTVFYKVLNRDWPAALLWPFILNLIFNFAFTYIQFGLKNNFLAAIDIILVLVTLIWALLAIYPHARWITFVNIPYLCWVAFATVLQLTITFLNR
jgi:tryptophan-rich sensory protein